MPPPIKTAIDIGRRALLGLKRAPKTNLPAVIPPTQQGSGPLERMIEKPRTRRGFLRGAARAMGSQMLPRLPLKMLGDFIPQLDSPLSKDPDYPLVKEFLYASDKWLHRDRTNPKDFEAVYDDYWKKMATDEYEPHYDMDEEFLEETLSKLTQKERDQLVKVFAGFKEGPLRSSEETGYDFPGLEKLTGTLKEKYENDQDLQAGIYEIGSKIEEWELHWDDQGKERVGARPINEP
jgi:hypothetical protein